VIGLGVAIWFTWARAPEREANVARAPTPRPRAVERRHREPPPRVGARDRLPQEIRRDARTTQKTREPAVELRTTPQRDTAHEPALEPVQPLAAPLPERPRNRVDTSLLSPIPSIDEGGVAPVASPLETEVEAVHRVLQRYEKAYTQLDASAAAAVWPSVDRRGLAQVFARLEQQNLTLRDCVVAVSEDDATAECAGVLVYVPRVGNATRRTETHSWIFQIQRKGEDWRIVQVTAR
jgi:hypothetical protein